jgi:hypothetical protein
MSHRQFYNEIRSATKPANETSMATWKPQHPKFHAHSNAPPGLQHVQPLPSQWITYKQGHIFTKPRAAFGTLLPTSNIHHSSGYLPSHGTRCCTLRGKIEACPSSHGTVTNSLTCSMRKFPPTFKIQMSHKLRVRQQELEIKASIM